MIELLEGLLGLALAWSVFFVLVGLNRLRGLPYYWARKRLRNGEGGDEWLLKDLF